VTIVEETRTAGQGTPELFGREFKRARTCSERAVEGLRAVVVDDHTRRAQYQHYENPEYMAAASRAAKLI